MEKPISPENPIMVWTLCSLKNSMKLRIDGFTYFSLLDKEIWYCYNIYIIPMRKGVLLLHPISHMISFINHNNTGLYYTMILRYGYRMQMLELIYGLGRQLCTFGNLRHRHTAVIAFLENISELTSFFRFISSKKKKF